MPLTDIEIRQTKPGATPIKLTDGAGMFLLLNPNGFRYWRSDIELTAERKRCRWASTQKSR
jgi:hypothetical protein